MADWLLVRIPREPESPASWMVADAGGRMVVAPQTGELSQAAALAPGRRVCALVPGTDVLLVDAEVPVKAGAKILQVVPYALEEQLAEDIENLHFAVGKRPANSTRTPVAVVSRVLMTEWLDTLRAAGLSPEFMYADSSLLPENPGQMVALLDGDVAIIRPPGALPLTVPIDALAEGLQITPPGEAAGETISTRSLILYTGAAEWHQRQNQVEALRPHFDGIKVQLLTDGPLALLAQQVPQGQAINLLQGAFTPQSSFAVGWKSWRLAAMLLAGLIALHAAGRAAQIMVLKKSEQALDQSIAETFRMAMPGEQNTSNARRRMEQRLLATQGGDSSTGLLAALSAVAEARQTAPESTLLALSYREGALDLRLTAPDANSLDRISQSLRASGWQADLTSASAIRSSGEDGASKGYEGRIQIKPRGS